MSHSYTTITIHHLLLPGRGAPSSCHKGGGKRGLKWNWPAAPGLPYLQTWVTWVTLKNWTSRIALWPVCPQAYCTIEKCIYFHPIGLRQLCKSLILMRISWLVSIYSILPNQIAETPLLKSEVVGPVQPPRLFCSFDLILWRFHSIKYWKHDGSEISYSL